MYVAVSWLAGLEGVQAAPHDADRARPKRSSSSRSRKLGGMRLVTLKHRSEFLRIRGGVRADCSAFLIEAKARPAERSVIGGGDDPTESVRFGFTVTKKLGGAVDRNRIRRRLKEALRALDAPERLAKFDCVIVARKSALDRPFADLKDDLTKALARLERDASRGGPSRDGRGAKRTGTG